MSSGYRIQRMRNILQSQTDTTFCGGIPRLPRSIDLPKCKLCNADLTFFFQAKFPATHEWEGASCAVFACTECADENHLIPPMIAGQLKGALIPPGFLDSYQKNFAIYVFADFDAVLRQDYVKANVKFERWELNASDVNPLEQSFVGGTPSWVQEDESPGSYGDSIGLCFLMQIQEGFEFPIEIGAPHQVVLGLDGKPKRTRNDYYKLFIGNQIYFFGTLNGEKNRKVYIITQRS